MKPNQTSQFTKDLLIKFERELKQLPHIINFMVSYPLLADEIGIHKTVTHEDVRELYSGWLYMHERFENKAEIDFYQKHWFKINDIYIDLSDKNFPMFFTEFIGFEDGVWAVNPITPNLNEFIKKLDDPNFNIKAHFSNVIDNLMNLTEQQFGDEGFDDF